MTNYERLAAIEAHTAAVMAQSESPYTIMMFNRHRQAFAATVTECGITLGLSAGEITELRTAFMPTAAELAV